MRGWPCTELHLDHRLHLPEGPGSGQWAPACPLTALYLPTQGFWTNQWPFYFFIQGSPEMLRLQECVYLFEWATPLVCSDATRTNTSGCQLTDSQLQFTFELSVLSGIVEVSSVGLLSPFRMHKPNTSSSKSRPSFYLKLTGFHRHDCETPDVNFSYGSVIGGKRQTRRS